MGVPRDLPLSPHVVHVEFRRRLASALAQAAPGDVITLAKGHYQGPFTVERSGTAADPIVIKAAVVKRPSLNRRERNMVSLLPVLTSISKI